MPFFVMMRRLGWLLLALFALAACAPATTNPSSAAPATATTAPPATQTAASGGLIVQPTAEPTPTAEVLAAASGLPNNKPAFLDSFADW